MMFDPPDFPYKDLNETIKEHYGPEAIIFKSTNLIQYNTNDKMVEHDSQLLGLHADDHGNDLNSKRTTSENINITNNSELYVVSDNLFNNESILLDDNTVNQFLLPIEVTTKESNEENYGPDLLSLHSCYICHEIFISESDLLEHSTTVHDINREVHNDNTMSKDAGVLNTSDTISSNETENNLQMDTEWLVCEVCQRVLSTVLEVEPIESLCCKDEDGKTLMSKRTLCTMYVCEFCSSLFADSEALDRHQALCNSQNKENFVYEQNVDNENLKLVDLCFSCDVCGMQNSSVEELKLHALDCKPMTRVRRQRNGFANKMWNCGSCNQLFATARDLYRHKRGEDRPEGVPLTAFICDECDKVLGSMCALHTHKKMHKITKPGYPCRICGRRFNQSGHLAIHMRMHTGERPYPCDLCSKAFKVKVERDDHRRTHTGERPFACSACPKTFTAAARLREHARIHTDQRPYLCNICGAAFRRPYARTVHTLIHTGAKPHECDICGTAFRRSGDMWKHKRTLHGSSTGNIE